MRFLEDQIQPLRQGISQMELSHMRPVTAARFDDPNLVSSAGLVPMMALAQAGGLLTLADEHLSVPTEFSQHE